MNVREKLVELLKKADKEVLSAAETGKPYNETEVLGRMADNLIAHGVTVQEWISVDDMLPEPETDVIAFAGDYIDILSYRYDRRGNLAFMYMDDSGWWHERIRPSVTHWCAMPQPPKGE